jgi:membrane protease YdiL (CAAX protease family)
MGRYLTLTRSHSYSLLFALPLLLLYEVGAVYIARAEGSAFRNGADVLLRTLFLLGGLESSIAVAIAVILVATVFIVRERRRRRVPLRATPFLGMVAESVVYAAALGVVVGGATDWLLDGVRSPLAAGGLIAFSLTEGIVLSLGAGLYEELVFRVALVGGLFAIFKAIGLGGRQAGVASVILASLLFSAFHYIGPFGDTLALPSFIFRFLAGVTFSALFLVRGFGITAWTHALYDIFLVLAAHAQ